jgi:hypothetical protein
MEEQGIEGLPAPDHRGGCGDRRHLSGRHQRDRLKAAPPTGFSALARVDKRIGDDPFDEAADIPPTEGFDVSDDNLARFVPLLARAKVGAVADLKRAANSGYAFGVNEDRCGYCGGQH